MHAFLLVTGNQQPMENVIDKITKKIGAKKTLEFPVQKIEDVRNLNSFVKLKLDQPTTVIVKNIDEVTEEAANAFLKNLEEPQENLYYILLAASARKVLPTIVSRCQVIKTINKTSDTQLTINNEAEKFLDMSVGKKLAYLDRIKDREEAKKFVLDLISHLHSELHGKRANYSEVARYSKIVGLTFSRLAANGNVTLQLANMAISLSNEANLKYN